MILIINMALEIGSEAFAVFIVFILVVFIFYRLFKLVLHATFIGALGFAFPWIAEYLGLGLGIEPTFQNGLFFAAILVGMFAIYEFFHIIKALFKVITIPIGLLFGKKQPSIGQIKKEVLKHEKKKKSSRIT